jgi:hypothetical protein
MGKDIIQVLRDDTDRAMDLTGASGVSLVVRSALSGRRLVGKFTGSIDQTGTAPNIVNQGQVRVPVTALLVQNPGDYLYEYELTMPGPKPATVPNNGYGTLRIDPDLG